MTRFEMSSLVWVLCAAAVIVSPAQTFKSLASFELHVNDGYPQYMSLVQGNDGNLYGTTPADWGTVFKITTAGELTVVCYFGESDCPGGAFPYAGLIQAADGNFYGTTWQGSSGTVYGAGTVFEITAGGQPITLYGFCSKTNCADGGEPYAPLVQATDKNFYGTTFDGGAKGYGTVFGITSAGALTTLHSFGYADGAGSVAGLVQAKNGNFYGTTLYGGAHAAGTVFEITAGGKLTTLHSFCSAKNCIDGADPYSGLVQSTDGNFYGTTHSGGAHGRGTVFRIAPGGKLTTLYSFCSQTKCTDGADPYAGVIQAADGNFYGTTSQGGASNWGTVFEITSAGKLTTLHSFCQQKNCTDGADPVGGLVQAASGTFYGTTAEGGVYENGTVFSLSPGLSPSAEDEVASEQVETPVTPPPTYRKRAIGNSFAWLAHDHSAVAPKPLSHGLFNCSPAPCVLPPTQASEGGGMVTDSPIVTNPLNAKQLLLGSVDDNCNALGFHLSSDGGSTWKVTCMASIYGEQVWSPLDEPQVGYDRKGAAYIAGLYFPSEGRGSFVAFQKSTDGTHWSKPAVALLQPRGSPYEASMTVDTSPNSPRVNSVYISAVMASYPGMTQVLVSHSTDGGTTWTQAAVDPGQKYPARHDFTRMAVGKDGTVYIAWMQCPGFGPDSGCGAGMSQMMFSKSTDGGNTWSPPRLMTKMTMPITWTLPNANDVRVYNYPVIGVDNSNGAHAGNLYVAMYIWTGAYLRLQVIRSSDGGTTWSNPVPVAPATDTHDQFFPSLSVNDAGQVGISWLDRRNDLANIDYQAFAAISIDGGRTFPNTQLTKAFSNPDQSGDPNWMGDYTGNTWAGGDFIAAWMDSSNGTDMQEVIGGIRLH
jgi:uncharacterized repeat protein (TIGR03803 family)